MDAAEIQALNAAINRCMMHNLSRSITQSDPPAVRCAMKHTQSQHAEDLLMLPLLLELTRGRQGSFVELGALDGNEYSNTNLLEKKK